jgi:hypothetical protein
MSEIRATTISNAAGTGPITMTGQYAAKAWVNFNGTGTVAIRESGNVGSITDNGTGDYTVNFTTAMTDANYSVVCGNILNRQTSSSRLEGTNVRTTTQCQVYGSDPATFTDFPFMEFSITR